MFNHIDFIEQHLKEPIKKQGILKVGINLNDYLSFNDANIYAENYAKKFTRKYTNDKARQSKSSKDSGQEISRKLSFICLIIILRRTNSTITNNKTENEIIKFITETLKIQKKHYHSEKFDTDIII